jgi:dolichyl-phosphate-mannose--protein O-mannosyl transferase
MDEDREVKVKRRGKKGSRAKDPTVSQSVSNRNEGGSSGANKSTGKVDSVQGAPSSSLPVETDPRKFPVKGHPIRWKFWTLVKRCATELKMDDTTGHYEVNVVLLVLVFLAVLTRVWIISEPSYTVFDEVHFGKFSSLYLQGKHFFDVHPPLGKLIFAAVGYLFGYDGGFLFEQINMMYPSTVPYIAMRSVSAIAGVLLVPCIYQIMRELGFSFLVSNLAALFIVFDNALIIQSRVIMLDSMTILMTYSAFLFYLKFCNCERMWSTRWNVYLLLSALSLGTLLGIKYTGILGMGFLGVVVLLDLYQLIADDSVSLPSYLQGFLVRGIALIGIPLVMNVALFYIHFSLTTKAGIHDGWLSPQMKAVMEGSQAQIAHDSNSTMLRYGARMTLRHSSSNCWLHSHDHVYPLKYDDGRGSSHQQHVTCYEFADKNNEWIIRKPGSPDSSDVPDDPSPVRHGDIVEFVHGYSRKLLNSHDVAAPLTPQMQEVAGYINYSAKFVPYLHWKIEVQHNSGNYPIYWLPGKTQITLKHEHSGQLLTTSGKRLPEWGFKQFEAVTSKTADVLSSLWFIEDLIVPGGREGTDQGDSLSVTAVDDDGQLINEDVEGRVGAELVEEEEDPLEEDELEEDELDKEGAQETDEEMNKEEKQDAGPKSNKEKLEDDLSKDDLSQEDLGEETDDEESEGDKDQEDLDMETPNEEDNLKPPLPGSGDGSGQNVVISFWEQYYRIQSQMLGAHGSMSDHNYGSRPLQWMLMKKTLPYWLDSVSNCQVTLIGNPFTWWMGSAACVLFPLLILFYLLRRRRQCYDSREAEFFQLSRSGALLFVGWLIHFLPFFFISRVLFLHHYLPSLPFKYMLLAAMLEHFMNLMYRIPKLKRFAQTYLPVIISAVVITGFLIFAPFVYGSNMSSESILRRHWVQSWDFLYHRTVVQEQV